MEGDIVVRLLNTIVLGGVVMVAWLLFEPVWKGVSNMYYGGAEHELPKFTHVGIPMDCKGCENMVEKWRFTWLECTQSHWKHVTAMVQALKSLPTTRIPDTVSLVAAPKHDLMEIGFRSQYNWKPKPEVVAEVFRVKKKHVHEITNNSDGPGCLGECE